MFLTADVCQNISDSIEKAIGIRDFIKVVRPVSGGSINNCYQIEYCNTRFFLKVNSALRYPDMFFAEAEGLKRIGETGAIKVPLVFCHGEFHESQYLVLEWIEPGKNTAKAQEQLGNSIAKLHKSTSESYGLDHNNYIGSLPQSNSFEPSIVDFFINQRIKPQLKLAERKRLIENSILNKFDGLFEKLDCLIPEESPTLVHGDLWGGNYMISAGGEPVLIDPAISFSSREFDLAMSNLFGGFDIDFYHAYSLENDLISGWEQRVHLWNIYPLLVHVNLFGPSYLPKVESCLNKFL